MDMDKNNLDKTLKTLGSLSKINLTDAEKNTAAEFFDLWINKFDTLENINTENIEPLVTVSSLENVMREDMSDKMVNIEELLENAPEQYNGYFVVPRILE